MWLGGRRAATSGTDGGGGSAGAAPQVWQPGRTPAARVDLCGRFGDVHLKMPPGFSVYSCATSGETGQLVLKGPGEVKPVCRGLKEWAKDAGFAIEVEVDQAGTAALTVNREDVRLSLACTTSPAFPGQILVAASLTPYTGKRGPGRPGAPSRRRP